jgi:hypothetical protein
MSILSEDEYRELFEVANEYNDLLSRLSDDSMELDFDERPEGIEELNDAGAVIYRMDEENGLYAVSSSMGDVVLEHMEKGGTVDQYLNAMDWQEQRFDEVYSSKF